MAWGLGQGTWVMGLSVVRPTGPNWPNYLDDLINTMVINDILSFFPHTVVVTYARVRATTYQIRVKSAKCSITFASFASCQEVGSVLHSMW